MVALKLFVSRNNRHNDCGLSSGFETNIKRVSKHMAEFVFGPKF